MRQLGLTARRARHKRCDSDGPDQKSSALAEETAALTKERIVVEGIEIFIIGDGRQRPSDWQQLAEMLEFH